MIFQELIKDNKPIPEESNLNFPSTAIVMIVGTYCNLRCSYCVHHATDRGKKQIMELNLLKKFIKEFLELPLQTFIFNWHGGEPLLAGLDFFKQIVEFQQRFSRKSQKIRNLIQTNGTLINKEWASFFNFHNFGIGVSLDGNKESHDRFRIDENGQGSFKKVIKGIKILRKHNIEPGILQTLTSESVSRVVENFQFFVDDLGTKNFAINPYYDVQKLNKNMTNQMVSNKEFISFLKILINLWLIRDDENLQVREIDDFLGAILEKPVLCACDFNGLCRTGFCLNYDGKVYLCDSVLGREEFFIGDISKQTLFNIFTSDRWQEIIRNINTFSSDCKICEWQTICHNGCIYHRVGKARSKYYYCFTRKKFLSYVKKIFYKYFLEKEVVKGGTKETNWRKHKRGKSH